MLLLHLILCCTQPLTQLLPILCLVTAERGQRRRRHEYTRNPERGVGHSQDGLRASSSHQRPTHVCWEARSGEAAHPHKNSHIPNITISHHKCVFGPPSEDLYAVVCMLPKKQGGVRCRSPCLRLSRYLCLRLSQCLHLSLYLRLWPLKSKTNAILF